MAIKNEGEQTDAIRQFWLWFRDNSEALLNLYRGNQYEELGRQVTNAIDKIEPDLGWEIGPGKKEPHLLTVSAEGNPTLRSLADRVIQSAPPMKGWEFYSSRPSRAPAEVVRLPRSGESFITATWEFIPIEDAASGRVELAIVDDHLARSDPQIALSAVSIYLDELLGEDVVENWIGSLEIKSRLDAHGKTTHNITDLPEYLYWARNRPRNPLDKHDLQ